MNADDRGLSRVKREAPTVGSAISVKDIRKNFGTVEALRGVSLEVDEAGM